MIHKKSTAEHIIHLYEWIKGYWIKTGETNTLQKAYEWIAKDEENRCWRAEKKVKNAS